MTVVGVNIFFKHVCVLSWQIVECLYHTEPLALTSKTLRFLIDEVTLWLFKKNDGRITPLKSMDESGWWDNSSTISPSLYSQAMPGLKEPTCVSDIIHFNFFINPLIFVSRKREQLMFYRSLALFLSRYGNMIFCWSGFMFVLESPFIVFPCKQSAHVTEIKTLLPCLICLFSFLHRSD